MGKGKDSACTKKALDKNERARNVQIERTARETNDALRCYFRASHRFRLARREGSLLYVDTDPTYVDFFEKLLELCDVHNPLLRTTRVEEAQRIVSQRGDEGIRAVITEVMRGDFASNTEGCGVDFVGWLKENHPTIPVLIVTRYKEIARALAARLPSVEVFVKGSTPAQEYVQALGLVAVNGGVEELGMV